jgi:hypothetical protein
MPLFLSIRAASDSRTSRSLPEAAGKNDTGLHHRKRCPAERFHAVSHDRVLPENVFAVFWPWDYFTT